MWCPSCGAEYRPGFTHCPDCDVDLVSEQPTGRGSAHPHIENPRLVPIFSGELEDGEAVQALLQSKGIASAVVDAMDDEIEVNIVVAAEQVPISLEILQRQEWGALVLEEDDPEFEEGVDIDEDVAEGDVAPEPDRVEPAPDAHSPPSDGGPIASVKPWWRRRSKE